MVESAEDVIAMVLGLAALWFQYARRNLNATWSTEHRVIARRGMFLFWLVGALVAGSAWGQVAPRILQLDAITCRELQALPGEQRDRFLIYLTGYLDGQRGATAWDEGLTGQRIDRALAVCKSSPEASVLRVFTEAWSR
jgi:HdeA/HdeB family